MTSRRSVLRYAGLAAAASLSPAKARDRDFTWVAAAGGWADTLKEAMVDPSLGGAAAEMREPGSLAMIRAGCAAGAFDVVNTTDAAASSLAPCLEDYDPDVMAEAGKLYPAAQVGSVFAPFALMVFGLAWNTKEATRPASMTDLFLARYRGKVGIPAYGWYGAVWLPALNRTLGGDESDVSRGMAAVAELARSSRAVFVESAEHGASLMTSGEVVIMPHWNGRTAGMTGEAGGLAFETVPGSVLVGSGFAVAKGSSHRKQAQSLVRYSLGATAQLAFAKWSMYPPSNRDVPLPPQLQSIALSSADLAKVVKLDWVTIRKHRAANLDRWNREVLGG